MQACIAATRKGFGSFLGLLVVDTVVVVVAAVVVGNPFSSKCRYLIACSSVHMPSNTHRFVNSEILIDLLGWRLLEDTVDAVSATVVDAVVATIDSVDVAASVTGAEVEGAGGFMV